MAVSVLVTGAAGFIGFHVARRLLARGDSVVGVDNMNGYYDVALKRARLRRLEAAAGFDFRLVDVADRQAVSGLFDDARPARVVHMAAQAGVRYSLQNPHAYVDSNLVGFVNVLEGCRSVLVEHLVYASSSSVYGASAGPVHATSRDTDRPVSLYAATKGANELMAHAYSHLFGIPATGLRLFTVYGPWGRPDMAPILFCRAILEGRPIDVYNEGRMWRDFTYVDDAVDGVIRALDRPPRPGDAASPCDGSARGSGRPPHRLYDIGNRQAVELARFIDVLEECLGRRAIRNRLPMQAGDVVATLADITRAGEDLGFIPTTPVEVGVRRMVAWCRQYYGEPRPQEHAERGEHGL